MPPKVTDFIHWCLSTSGLRWARQDSGELIGQRSPAAFITNERKRILAYSAPTARPQKTGALVGSRLRLEWIARGCTVMCFWTGTRRLIVSLESELRSGPTTGLLTYSD